MSIVCQPVPRQASQRPPGELKEKSRAVTPRETARADRAKAFRISSQAFVYVTGFERAERPRGLWSTSRRSAIALEAVDPIVRADFELGARP